VGELCDCFGAKLNLWLFLFARWLLSIRLQLAESLHPLLSRLDGGSFGN
jgi:hypothetical protein